MAWGAVVAVGACVAAGCVAAGGCASTVCATKVAIWFCGCAVAPPVLGAVVGGTGLWVVDSAGKPHAKMNIVRMAITNVFFI